MEVSKIFPTRSTSVNAYFTQRPGAAFYIPLYQREYSWGESNVSQMMEDIMKGVSLFTEGEHDQEKIFKFLGTLITVQAKNNQINAGEIDSLPTRVDMVIDGQQRLSTLSLIGSQIYPRIYKLSKLDFIKSSGLEIFTQKLLKQIKGLFSIHAGYGSEGYRPIIIRESYDKWTLTSDSKKFYRSPIAHFTSKVIDLMDSGENVPRKDIQGEYIASAIKVIRSHLDEVENAHLLSVGDYPAAWSIVSDYPAEELWESERSIKSSVLEVKAALDNGFGGAAKLGESISKIDSQLMSFVQLVAFSRFMLNRWGFTVIEPESEEWAFDMFQSLNATGTPLTAIETFKPYVIGNSETDINKGLRELFSDVDNLFKSARTPASKTKLTNSYFSILAVINTGYKLSNRFSEQRSYLLKWYKLAEDSKTKEKMLRDMSNLAVYMRKVSEFKTNKDSYGQFNNKIQPNDRSIVNLCQVYLLSTGHDISHSVIAKAFGNPEESSVEARKNFSETIKSVAAFYTLWRSAKSNSGLDNAYRAIFKEGKDGRYTSDFAVTGDVEHLKSYFCEVLQKQKIWEFEQWYAQAFTRFESRLAGKDLCKFALMVAVHDTRVDEPPYVVETTKGYRSYLSPELWFNLSLASVEHVAPQVPSEDSGWDKRIYVQGSQLYDKIGNLTLLPQQMNSSAGNRNWKTKYFYYAYLSALDATERLSIIDQAASNGISINPEIMKDLKRMSYQGHLEPIKEFGFSSEWDSKVIIERTENISKILFGRMKKWLS